MTSARSAEAAPDHLRGRYLSLVQLAWTSPQLSRRQFAWLLDRGETALWLAVLAVTLFGVGVSALLGRVMPLAAAPVTNEAELLSMPLATTVSTTLARACSVSR